MQKRFLELRKNGLLGDEPAKAMACFRTMLLHLRSAPVPGRSITQTAERGGPPQVVAVCKDIGS
jgi:hypothetical protein